MVPKSKTTEQKNVRTTEQKNVKTPQIQISMPDTGEEEWQALRDPIMSGWLTQGNHVAQLEKSFALRHGVNRAIACSSCTTGLHLILEALGIGNGDEVIVPAFTWVATANSVCYTGATPVFADINPTTFNLDPKSLKEKITPKTKAIIPVHLFGLCADIDEIKNIVGSINGVGSFHGVGSIDIIEDAACAAGSEYKGTLAGGLGKAAAFSFHPRKSITCGEGGMITTNDEQLGELIGKLRNHGAEISEEQRHYGQQPYLLPEFNLLGYNYRMSDLHGAVAKIQLSKLDRLIKERKQWANFYQRELSSIKWLQLPQEPDGYSHSWQSYVIFINENIAPMSRNEMMKFLMEKGIATRPGTHAVHTLGYYKQRFGFKPQDFPKAFAAAQYSMAIPLHNRMCEADFQYITKIFQSIT